MKKHFKHVRHHAKAHHRAHHDLNELLKKDILTEGVLGLFLSTLIISISIILIAFNWHKLSNIFSTEGVINRVNVTKEEVVIKEAVIKPFNLTQGSIKGVMSIYGVSQISEEAYVDQVLNVSASTYEDNIPSTNEPNHINSPELATQKSAALEASAFLTNHLSQGGYLNSIRTGNALQKSVLSTFYLGEKTVSVNSSLQTDSRLLSQINNTLSVDIFAYLNQSVNRAESLDSYLNLLKTLEKTAQQRSTELASQINFLSGNFEAQDRSIELTEEAFFRNIQAFDGENAEGALAEFIGLEKAQSEVRAKMGAYRGLKDYYDNFLPLLANHIDSITKNRDPLIAGVKVVEVQNMTLPLIIQDR